ncbi:E3 ubiquitin-protein ligase MBR2 [Camellia lanceoleosa]|uniref:E3 ubiquitin-protein ligase MBR2 n=1 Tax=Camellia lanceoleosa TaxID=1840588 RepID=A0ACC0HZE3_9ERIC|nr:E3 ubiquitin-protein ligase MBR2 [Camellia lanceoleosa]
MNLVEEYEEGLSNFLQPAILSLVDSMMIAEGHNAAVPSIVPALEQFSVERALLDDMIVGPMFYESDMHEDMCFDVDNMSYEELLALEDEMGTVNTGLSEVAILDVLKQHSYQSMKLGGGGTMLCLSGRVC